MQIAVDAQVPFRWPPTEHPMEVLDRLLGHGVVVSVSETETGQHPQSDSEAAQPSSRILRARRSRRRRRTPPGQWALDWLGRATQGLAMVSTLLREAPYPERDRLLAAVRGVESALGAATNALRARLGDGVSPASKRLHAWLHDLGGPLTVIIGWARMLSQTEAGLPHTRAVVAIERNSKQLIELLGQLPR